MHLVMFDIDGTLIQSNEFDDEFFLKAVSEILGMSISSNWEEYQNVTDSGILDEIINKHGGTVDREQVHHRIKARYTELTEQYLEKNSEAVKEVDGANSFILSLKSRENVCIAFATGGWEETAKLKLKAIGVDTEGIAFASSSDEGSRTKIMELAEKRTNPGTRITSKTYFGDAIWDREACEHLSYGFVAVGKKVEHHARIDDFSHHKKVYKLLGI